VRKILLMPIVLLMIASTAFVYNHQQPRHQLLTVEPLVFIPSTTTSSTTTTSTTLPPTTTTVKKPSPPPTTKTTQAVVYKSQSAAPTGGDFWERLANCESPTNSWSGRYKGYFQFSDTNVWNANNQWGFHYTPTASYGEQKAAAQYLAAHADPYGQWPVCWPRAIRGG
jgi:hypothetical protein